MMLVERGARRTSKPDIFISHSSKDKLEATRLAETLNFCSIDVWLDDWELEIGQSLTEELSKAMNESKYIAILITPNYNKTVWTKTEYKKALTREQLEGKVVMLPIVIGEAEIPDFIEDKIFIDLQKDYYAGIVKIVGLVHKISNYRLSKALKENPPYCVRDIWRLLESIGHNPFIVLGQDDFQEALKYGGQLVRENYATFNPTMLVDNPRVSEHVQDLLREIM
ncbi:toll/interleukin-1 receptor domain-containing protein [Methylotenera sp. 1P/1]|uniref:toll/interleukin-1 receptor domain-containing protein n=1 Tax=Methylotenera sp. 1P/1 TaxID=1131551 RepID=UPI00037DE5B1|nr:toll/interleukin-1 receptor domain-containing protein [Methylotenera sp. 1P/1]